MQGPAHGGDGHREVMARGRRWPAHSEAAQQRGRTRLRSNRPWASCLRAGDPTAGHRAQPPAWQMPSVPVARGPGTTVRFPGQEGEGDRNQSRDCPDLCQLVCPVPSPRRDMAGGLPATGGHGQCHCRTRSPVSEKRVMGPQGARTVRTRGRNRPCGVTQQTSSKARASAEPQEEGPGF